MPQILEGPVKGVAGDAVHEKNGDDNDEEGPALGRGVTTDLATHHDWIESYGIRVDQVQRIHQIEDSQQEDHGEPGVVEGSLLELEGNDLENQQAKHHEGKEVELLGVVHHHSGDDANVFAIREA